MCRGGGVTRDAPSEEIYYVWVGERKMSRVREESNSRRVCARGPEQPVSHMGS